MSREVLSPPIRRIVFARGREERNCCGLWVGTVRFTVLHTDYRRFGTSTRMSKHAQRSQSMRYALAGVACLILSATASADDVVTVTDMTQLRWQADASGKIYIRNLNQFDSTFLGCCYNYYIDTTTPDGKIKWSAVLTYMQAGGSLYFYVANKSQPSPVTFVGN